MEIYSIQHNNNKRISSCAVLHLPRVKAGRSSYNLMGYNISVYNVPFFLQPAVFQRRKDMENSKASLHADNIESAQDNNPDTEHNSVVPDNNSL